MTFGRLQRGADFSQRFLEVFVNVIAERFQRGNVNDVGFILELSLHSEPEQRVQRCEKCGERLARTGWRGDERVRSRLNGGPAVFLRRCWRPELLLEPAGENGMKLEPVHRVIA